MKRTTYILIGVFFVNILLLVGYLAYCHTLLTDTSDLSWDFASNNPSATIDLSDVHTVEFSGIDNNERFYFVERGIVNVTSSRDGAAGVMRYPVSDSLKVDKKDGVLRVNLDFPNEDSASKEGIRGGIAIKGLMIDIEAGQSLMRIAGNGAFSVSLNAMQTDSLNLKAVEANVDSCAIRSLVFDGNELAVNRSQIDNLHIDLDNLYRRSWEDFTGSTLYVTGSHNHDVVVDPFDRVVWIPKNEKASLGIRLETKSEVTIKR